MAQNTAAPGCPRMGSVDPGQNGFRVIATPLINTGLLLTLKEEQTVDGTDWVRNNFDT